MRNKHTLVFKNLDNFAEYINKKYSPKTITIGINPIPVLSSDNSFQGIKGIDVIQVVHTITCFIDELNQIVALEYPSKQQYQITAITPSEKETMVNKILEQEINEINNILFNKIEKDMEILKYCEIL
jgi:hypothetical protein